MTADGPLRDCVQRAYLYLARDVEVGEPPYGADQLQLMEFEPEAVTRAVGLPPTRSWRRGDPHPRRSEPRRFSNWEYALPEVRTYDTEEVVIALLDAIEPHAAGIVDACGILGMRAGIMVVIEMSGDRDTLDGDIDVSTAAIRYSSRTLHRLARLDLSIGLDQ